MESELGQYRSEEERQAALTFEGKSQETEKSVEMEKPKPLDAIIVLGGGLKDPVWKTFQEKHPKGVSPTRVKIEKSEGWMLPIDAKMRTIAAVQMYLDGLTMEMIFTGGKTATDQGIEISEAQKMKEYAQHLLEKAGIDKEKIDQAIILEDQATNTIENVANVCNIIDADKGKYQALAVLTNGYHLDRAKKLMGKFDLDVEGVAAEEQMLKRSKKYQKVLDRFFDSPGYQARLAGERRWTAGLDSLPSYFFPQAIAAVENPDRLYQIMKSIYGPALTQKLGKETVLKNRENLQKTSRAMPLKEWGER